MARQLRRSHRGSAFKCLAPNINITSLNFSTPLNTRLPRKSRVNMPPKRQAPESETPEAKRGSAPHMATKPRDNTNNNEPSQTPKRGWAKLVRKRLLPPQRVYQLRHKPTTPAPSALGSSAISDPNSIATSSPGGSKPFLGRDSHSAGPGESHDPQSRNTCASHLNIPPLPQHAVPGPEGGPTNAQFPGYVSSFLHVQLHRHLDLARLICGILVGSQRHSGRRP